jgi:hypothetical protein
MFGVEDDGWAACGAAEEKLKAAEQLIELLFVYVEKHAGRSEALDAYYRYHGKKVRPMTEEEVADLKEKLKLNKIAKEAAGGILSDKSNR